MPKESLTILALNPGARYLGFAYFHGPELRDWGTKAFKGRWSKAKAKKTIFAVSRLLDHYQPKVLALKQLHPSRSSQNLYQLLARLKRLTRSRKLKLHERSLEQLKARLALTGSKWELAQALVKQYPCLQPELDKEKASRRPYHLRMFEAVALGATCYDDLSQ